MHKMWHCYGKEHCGSDVVLLLVVPHAVQKEEAKPSYREDQPKQKHVGDHRASCCIILHGLRLLSHSGNLSLGFLGELGAAVRCLEIPSGLVDHLELRSVQLLVLGKN